MSKPKRLVFDLDGVLFNFNHGYGELLTKFCGDRLPADWRTDPEFPPIWDWDQAAGYTREEMNTVWTEITKKDSQFWAKLAPLEGAKEVVYKLNQRSAKDVEVIFLTNRLGHGVKRQSEVALYNLGMNYPTVMIAPSGEAKIPILRAIGADFFIDDRGPTILEAAQVSYKECWQNFNLFLLKKPYNLDTPSHPAITVVASPKEALELVAL